MKFCEECGTKLEKQVAFCTECGAPIKKEQLSSETKQKKRPIVKNKKNTKKVLISLFAFLLIGLFGTYKYLESHYNPVKKIQAMDKAYIENNQDEFVKHFNFDKESIVNETSFFNYVKEDEWEDNIKKEYLSYLDVQKTNKSLLSYTIESSDSEKFIIIEPKPILLGLFTSYDLKVIPVELTISSPVENTNVEIEGHEIELKEINNEAELGISPGKYQVNAVAKNDYGELKTKNELAVYPSKKIDYEIEFSRNIYSLDTAYDYMDAVVFINNESTKQTIEKLEEVGPFPDETKIKVHAEMKSEDGKVIKSELINISEADDHLYFEFDERNLTSDKVNDNEVAQFIHAYRSAYENAVNQGDYGEVNSFIKSGSAAEKDLKPFIDKIDSYYAYEFVENEVKSVEKKKDYYDVLITETLHFDNNSHDSKGYYYTKLKQDKRYYVEEVDGDYKLIDVKYFKETKEENKVY